MPRLEKSELVARMLNRLSSEEKWTKGMEGRGGRLQLVDPRGTYAERWCLIGCEKRELYDAGRELCGQGFVPDHITAELNREICKEFREQYPEMHVVTVIAYNDHPGMTLAGIRAVLEKVHVKLIERGQ